MLPGLLIYLVQIIEFILLAGLEVNVIYKTRLAESCQVVRVGQLLCVFIIDNGQLVVVAPDRYLYAVVKALVQRGLFS